MIYAIVLLQILGMNLHSLLNRLFVLANFGYIIMQTESGWSAIIIRFEGLLYVSFSHNI